MASALRKEGNQAKQEGKLQLAFVLLTKSVTCILEKIPSHSHYNELTATQRTNLTRVSDLYRLLYLLTILHLEWRRYVADSRATEASHRECLQKIY